MKVLEGLRTIPETLAPKLIVKRNTRDFDKNLSRLRTSPPWPFGLLRDLQNGNLIEALSRRG